MKEVVTEDPARPQAVMDLSPCPHGSYLSRQDDGPDIIKRPSAFLGRTKTAYILSACEAGCPLCARMPTQWYGDVESLREAWELTRTDLEGSESWLIRSSITLERMDEKNLR